MIRILDVEEREDSCVGEKIGGNFCSMEFELEVLVWVTKYVIFVNLNCVFFVLWIVKI